MRQRAGIFVLIDALGWEWIKTSSFLSGIASYRRPLKTVLGYSAGAIPSILTGRTPSEHGRLTMYRRAAPDASPFRPLRFICGLPPKLIENRYVRRLLKSVAPRLCNIEGYFELYRIPLQYLPLLDVPEKRCVYRPGGIPETPSIFDVLQTRSIPYRAYWYATGSDRQLMRRMEDDLQREDCGFYFLYLAGVDAFLHAHADDPALVTSFLAGYDAALRQIYEVAQSHFAHVGLHVFSDHGMAPTRATIDLPAVLYGMNLDPNSCLHLVDSTMARFWFNSESDRRAAKSRLSDGESGRWLGESELKSLGAWFPDHRYGDEIYLLSEGIVFAPSHMGATAPKGMHGFHPAALHSYASFLSNEHYGDQLSSITDIFPVMERYSANSRVS